MKDFTRLSKPLALILLSTTLCACIVVPNKVTSYDSKCMVATQKIELTVEQVETFHDLDMGLHCISYDCKTELLGIIASSAFVTTTSAIVSGSIALIGNTLYWVESQGKCPNINQQEKQTPNTPQEKTNDEYLIKEEIITAKS
jgi:hypothetical protein